MAENKGYMVDVEGKRCVTPELRGGYVNLIETQKFEDKDTGKVTESYGMQGMLEKSRNRHCVPQRGQHSHGQGARL
jgi:hypothetical protein